MMMEHQLTPRALPAPLPGADAETNKWREKAIEAEARASSLESQADSYWHARYLEAETRARTAEAALQHVETPAKKSPARPTAGVGSVASTPQLQGGGSPIVEGRHSAHLIMGRCITELSKIADDMRTTATATTSPMPKSSATVVEQAAVVDLRHRGGASFGGTS